MTTAPASTAPYGFTSTTGPRNVVTVPEPEPPLSPRTRAFVIGVRAALLLLCDALGALADLPKRA